jgi:Protein phosphatase 2C
MPLASIKNDREELIRLGAVKPTAGEQLVASAIPQLPPSPTSAEQEPQPPEADSNNDDLDGSKNTTEASPVKPTDNDQQDGESDEAPPSSEGPVDCAVDNHEVSSPQDAAVPTSDDPPGPQSEEGSGEDPKTNHDDADDDDDSVEVVGKEEAAMEREHDDNDDVIEEVHTPLDSPTNSSKVSIMFQRLLNMSNPTGQIVVQLTGQQPGDASHNAAAIQSPSASIPSLIRNGRLICNLPDHPIHAGATAIVAVFTGRTLTVANAGDSRAVLCRNGTAYPLSFDHKPLHERELSRIRNAGGFVNQFGRVNGNLNLSRSIGDLKYKQVPNISPAEQMITAEPDIVQYVSSLRISLPVVTLCCDALGPWAFVCDLRASIVFAGWNFVTKTSSSFLVATASGIALRTRKLSRTCVLESTSCIRRRLVSTS